jgi:predicted lipoprotein with Yx(FWY)xxD motif
MRRRLTALSIVALAAATVVPSALAATAHVNVGSSSAGSMLVDGHGKSLYLFGKDRHGKSSCSGACAHNWPPLLTTGKPKAGSGVAASKLGTVKRSGGKTQVTYAHHPLYGFIADGAPGDINGQGIDAFGGVWSLVAPSGSKLSGGGSTPSPSMPAPTPPPSYPY